MLDERKAAILKAIVREHVRTGQPVGSKTLSGRYRLRVSAATIRNDMALLDGLGFIAQPHTSAGRVPTDLGYRWFVDTWPAPPWPDLPERQKRAIREIARTKFRGLDQALEGTSQVLSDVTEATSVILAPPAEKNRIRRVELLRRDSRRATILLIADTGVVVQGVVEFGKDRREAELSRLAGGLNKELEGVLFEDVAAKLRAPGDAEGAPAADRSVVAMEVERILAADRIEKIFRGGTAKILEPDKFSDLTTAHMVIEALEQPDVLAGLLDAARNAPAILVFIGTELPIREMQSCAVVLAPYSVGPDRGGTVGVVGPTRMDYPHTISAVEAVARSLTRLLGSSVG